MKFELSETIYNLNDILCDVEFVKSKKHNELVEYANVACSFDIEVSSFYQKIDVKEEKCACMYIYVLGINGRVKIGRTWEEFRNDIETIKEFYNLDNKRRLIIYVHNLQYEFQFIRKRFDWDEVFNLEARRPVYARTRDGIEFRCSYILTNLSLNNVGLELNKYKVKKLEGDLNYNLIRNKLTPLTNKEMMYVIHDGLVVMARIQEYIESEGDIVHIPLTSTGFVRKLCKQNCVVGKDKWQYRQEIHKLTLSPLIYKLSKQAYQGGFTHANGFRVNTINYNVSSYDFTSSYIATVVAEKFPMSTPMEIDIDNEEELEKVINNFCCLLYIEIKDMQELFRFEHYISLNKCIDIKDYNVNNGRVVRAKYLKLVITELDYKIIKKVYKWESLKVLKCFIFYKQYLPREFVLTALQLYSNKTKLKGVKGQEGEYNKLKSLVNSVYGMCVTDPCKDITSYDNVKEWSIQKQDLEKCLEIYNNNWSRFLYYPWGVWITAYARYNLWTGILAMGKDYIYSDTDSLKILNKEKHIEYFNKYNSYIDMKMRLACEYNQIDYSLTRPKTIKGTEKPLGAWDYEGDYDRFKTLGAKRYLYSKGEDITITISGVNKVNGSEYLKHEYKTINNIFNNFTDNLSFPGEYIEGDKTKNANGKSTHTYIDIERKGIIIDYLGNKCEYDELSSVHMENCDYNISLSDLFKNYLMGIKEEVLI